MQIGCTKKLQEKMGIVAATQSSHVESDLFCWSAHVVTLNRKKTVIVVNDSSRFGFVLYGLKAKDFKRLDELILQGIRHCLRDEKITDEIIEKYLNEAGTINFSKTRGAKYVSRLNKACERVGFYEERLDAANIYQPAASRIVNNDLIKIDKESEYEHPYELICKNFKQVYGEHIIKCEAVDLIVKLDLGSYIAMRRIITPIDINFEQLHEMIQIAFDWKSSHLYDFNIFNKEGKCILNVISEFEEVDESRQNCPVILDSEAGISEYVNQKYKIDYRYDYGDNWEHEIAIQDIVADYDKNYPICIRGEGNAPPEDVGGIPGYEEYLEIMANPNHVEHKNMKQWIDSQWYNDFDIELVNRRLKHVLWK